MKNYAKKRILIFSIKFPENRLIFTGFIGDFNICILFFVYFLVQKFFPLLFCLFKIVICVSFLKIISVKNRFFQTIKEPKKGSFQGFYAFFLNRPLISNPRFSSFVSSALSEMNSMYLPVPMATQLTASSATMA